MLGINTCFNDNILVRRSFPFHLGMRVEISCSSKEPSTVSTRVSNREETVEQQEISQITSHLAPTDVVKKPSALFYYHTQQNANDDVLSVNIGARNYILPREPKKNTLIQYLTKGKFDGNGNTLGQKRFTKSKGETVDFGMKIEHFNNLVDVLFGNGDLQLIKAELSTNILAGGDCTQSSVRKFTQKLVNLAYGFELVNSSPLGLHKVIPNSKPPHVKIFNFPLEEDKLDLIENIVKGKFKKIMVDDDKIILDKKNVSVKSLVFEMIRKKAAKDRTPLVKNLKRKAEEEGLNYVGFYPKKEKNETEIVDQSQTKRNQTVDVELATEDVELATEDVELATEAVELVTEDGKLITAAELNKFASKSHPSLNSHSAIKNHSFTSSQSSSNLSSHESIPRNPVTRPSVPKVSLSQPSSMWNSQMPFLDQTFPDTHSQTNLAMWESTSVNKSSSSLESHPGIQNDSLTDSSLYSIPSTGSSVPEISLSQPSPFFSNSQIPLLDQTLPDTNSETNLLQSTMNSNSAVFLDGAVWQLCPNVIIDESSQETNFSVDQSSVGSLVNQSSMQSNADVVGNMYNFPHESFNEIIIPESCVTPNPDTILDQALMLTF